MSVNNQVISTQKFIINKKEVEFEILELNDTMGQVICLLNILGEPYWEEVKKVFNIKENIINKIDEVFK